MLASSGFLGLFIMFRVCVVFCFFAFVPVQSIASKTHRRNKLLYVKSLRWDVKRYPVTHLSSSRAVVRQQLGL